MCYAYSSLAIDCLSTLIAKINAHSKQLNDKHLSHKLPSRARYNIPACVSATSHCFNIRLLSPEYTGIKYILSVWWILGFHKLILRRVNYFG